MKQNQKKCVWMTAFALVAASGLAKPQVTVSGIVTDENKEAMPFVNVVLLSLPDSAFVQGTTTDADGRFRLEGNVPKGTLQFSSVGYQTLYYTPSAQMNVQMQENATTLGEVAVKAMLPKTKLTGNSMVTSVQGTVLSQSGTALEMLAKVPGMMAKEDDVAVLGKGKPVIYINGRKMSDPRELKQLRSEEIQSVEVITNPGAQYDATVSSVVRIKTVRRQGDGFGYALNVGNSQDLIHGYSDPNGGFNLHYRRKNLDLFGSLNYWEWDEITRFKDHLEMFYQSEDGVKSILQDSHSLNRYHDNGFDYTLGFNWQLGTNHSLGARVTRHDRLGAGTDLALSTDITHVSLLSAAENQENYSSVQKEKRHTPYNWESNAYYNGKVGKLGIDFNMDYLTNKLNEENVITEMCDYTNSNDMLQQDHNDTRLWASKLVLSYPVWKGQLEMGSEVSLVHRTYLGQIMGFSLPASDIQVKEKNIAAFLSYNFQLETLGNFGAGVRYEHVGFDYTDRLNADNNMSRMEDELFPNLSWSKQFGPVQTSLAYSFKTIRPNYNALNGHVIYINRYSFIQGDPKLKNSKMQEVSATVRWSWLNFFIAYERRDNTHSQLPFIFNTEGAFIMKNVALEKPVRNLAAFLTANPTFGCYNPNWMAGVQQYWNTMEFDDPCSPTGRTKEYYSRPVGFFDFNNAFRLPHSWLLEANLGIQTRGEVNNFAMETATCNLRFVVQKCWLPQDALCLRATLADVLQRSTHDISVYCGPYCLKESQKRNHHRLGVSLRYTFNASNNKYKGTGAGKAEQERMK
ncbi:MAG: outer membrane beta-barrel protein [Bacteroidales bacterium]|nr:outer membrane beta-barrel protein [Bacteroidales bacterium]